MKFLDFLTEKFSLTLQYHSRLNSKVWDKTELRDGIGVTVMDQAMAYAKFCKIPKERIKDVIITGGDMAFLTSLMDED